MDLWARAIAASVLVGAIHWPTTVHRAQEAQSTKPAECEALLTKVNNAVYPLLARQTQITGDVAIAVEIESDGRIRSASVVSGHPLLSRAALESAQGSQFECRKCEQTPRSLQLIYTYQLSKTTGCDPAPSPRVIQGGNHVTVIDQVHPTCDPAVTRVVVKVRSWRCFYLWRCASHVIWME